MKTLIRISLLLVMTGMLTACGSDEQEAVTKDGKVNVTKAMEFKVDFADYNTEEDVENTRTNSSQKRDTLSKRVVNLGNNILAEVTVQRDTTKTAPKVITRTLENGIYTMLAYQGGTYKGEVKGTINSGRFTYLGDEVIELDPGTYDFVLYNDKFTRSGNNITVKESDIQTALIGRTTYTVTAADAHQQVRFMMKHAGTRMRIKLTGYMNYGAIQSEIIGAGPVAVPSQAVYDASTNTWTTSNPTLRAYNTQYAFPAPTQKGNSYVTENSAYVYFVPSTDANSIMLHLLNGQIYYGNLANSTRVLSTLTMQANASYLINVKLMYNFWYLMSDGTIGLTDQTTYAGGTKTPVAVVLSRTHKLAMALKDANGGTALKWGYNGLPYQDYNLKPWGLGTIEQNRSITAFGEEYGEQNTWTMVSSVIKGNEQSGYPAFYYAGHYGDELAASGITVSGSLVGSRWFMPCNSEWALICTGLGIGESPTNSYTTLTKPLLADVACTQMGGDKIYGKYFWSSSYFAYYKWAEVVWFNTDSEYLTYSSPTIGDSSTWHFAPVRSFITYV